MDLPHDRFQELGGRRIAFGLVHAEQIEFIGRPPSCHRPHAGFYPSIRTASAQIDRPGCGQDDFAVAPSLGGRGIGRQVSGVAGWARCTAGADSRKQAAVDETSAERLETQRLGAGAAPTSITFAVKDLSFS